MSDTRFFRRWDWVPIVLALGIAWTGIRSDRGAAASATVTQNGTVIAVLDLTDSARQMLEVDGAYPLTVIAEHGTVRVSEASCPDQICVRAGVLSKPGDTAACLPAGVVIRINGTSADGMTG